GIYFHNVEIIHYALLDCRVNIDPQDPTERDDYFYAYFGMLDILGRSDPETALLQLRNVSDKILAYRDTGLLRSLGMAFVNREAYQDALPILEKAMEYIDDTTHEYDLKHTPDAL